MLERAEPILRLACILLAGLVVYQLSRVALQKDPLANLTLPVIAEKTSATSTNASAASGTIPSTQATNSAAVPSASNTNAASISGNTTNTAANGVTNSVASANASASATNNSTAALPKPGANTGGPRSGRPGGPPRSMGGMPPGMAPQPPLPAPIQARVDKIIQSEILGPVQRPIPMGLLGIAGRDAFFRAPNGQTGLLREGQELGGVKMLRIGTNRVLIEFEGKQQELMIFSGFGSQTLLPTGKETRP